MLVDDFDDERTMEEEEALSNEDSVGRELDDLQKVLSLCHTLDLSLRVTPNSCSKSSCYPLQ